MLGFQKTGHKFVDIPIYKFLSFCTADTDANTDILGNKLH